MKGFGEAFCQIELSAPWLTPFHDIHRALQAAIHDKGNARTDLYPWLNDYCAAQGVDLYNAQNQKLAFTAQHDLPHGTAYEAYIATHGKIPTRNNLHDWFNACIWMTLPKTKALLNAKHLAHIHDNHTNNKRNRLRDTLTVFDENGAVLVVRDDTIGKGIASALQGFDWQHCLVQSRECWYDHSTKKSTDKAQVFIFGHALLEQLITPRKPLCSHTFVVFVGVDFFDKPLAVQLALLDTQLAQKMADFLCDDITPKSLHPLPILGVPYFYDNANPSFYEDEFVFRKGRGRGNGQKP